VHIWINGEFSGITVNHPKLHNHYAAVISSNSWRLQTSTKQGKDEFAKCSQTKNKKIKRPYSVLVFNPLQTCSLVQTQVFFYQKHD